MKVGSAEADRFDLDDDIIRVHYLRSFDLLDNQGLSDFVNASCFHSPDQLGLPSCSTVYFTLQMRRGKGRGVVRKPAARFAPYFYSLCETSPVASPMAPLVSPPSMMMQDPVR